MISTFHFSCEDTCIVCVQQSTHNAQFNTYLYLFCLIADFTEQVSCLTVYVKIALILHCCW